MTTMPVTLADPAVADLLDRALRLPGPPWQSLGLVRVLRQVPNRRATVLGSLDGAPVVIKVFASPRARGNHRRLAALADAGLTDVVPASLRVDDSGHVGVLDYRPGTVLDTVDDATFVPACAAAGRTLARLHASSAPLDRVWGHDAETAQLLRRAPATTRAQAERAAALPIDEAAPLVCTHRDFHPRQVVVDDGRPVRVAFIDLDDAAMAPAGLDVGNMTAHLRREAVSGRRSRAVAEAAIEAFLSGYGPPPADLATWEVLALTRLAGLAETRHDRPDERDALLALLPEHVRATATEADTVSEVVTGHTDRPVRIRVLPSGHRVVLKRYVSADGAGIHDSMLDLWSSSFGARRAPGPGMPEPLGFEALSGELAMSHVSGEPLGSRGGLGLAVARADEVAALLADLHGSGVVVPRERRRSALLRSAARKSTAHPDGPVGAAFIAALAAVRDAWADGAGEPDELVVCHGDFSPRNLLCAEQGLVLIDFDRLQMSHPLRDVAYWSAWLWTTATMSREASSTEAWRLSDGFLTAYAARTGLDLHRLARELAVHQALGLIRIAHGWSALRSDPASVQRVLAMAIRLAQDQSP